MAIEDQEKETQETATWADEYLVQVAVLAMLLGTLLFVKTGHICPADNPHSLIMTITVY